MCKIEFQLIESDDEKGKEKKSHKQKTRWNQKKKKNPKLN